MKRLLIIATLTLLGLTQAAAQEYEYVPFVREGVKWFYNISDYHYYHLSDNPANGDNLYYRTLEFRGDTIINGKTYKAMHRCVDDELSEPSDVIPIYMREEDKRVYGIVPDGKFYDDAIISNTPIFGPSDVIYSGKEFLLYDFQDPMNVIINDWYGYNLKMDTIEVGGHLAKRYFYGAGAGDDFQIIEGIGATGMNSYPLAFLMPIGTGIHDTEYYWLEHVIEDGEVVYGSVRDRYMPLILEDVKWVFERVTVNDGDTICSYYTYEFKGNDPVKDNYGYTYKALYRYDGIDHELDVDKDSIVAGLREDWGNIRYYRNEPLSQVISQGRDMIAFNQKYLYYLLSEGNSWAWGKSLYIQYQKEPFLNDENFVEADPIMIGRYCCRRLAYIGEQGDTLAYIVQGIGFDSRDLGDLLTPFTRKPAPNAEYQEWCGLSHVIKNGEIIYKGMRYNEGNLTLAGDVDTDGRVTMDDLTALVNHLLDNNFSINMTNADMDANGKVGMDDLTDLINCLLTQTRK